MMWQDLLAWAVGLGSLLYFGAAMVKPVWFLGEPPAEFGQAPHEEAETPRSSDELQDWPQLGHSY